MTFEQISSNVAGTSCDLDSFYEQIDGCPCTNCGNIDSCPCQHYGTAYSDAGLLLSAERSELPIFECNRMCKCDSSCKNRLVQHSVQLRLDVFDTESEKGFGLRTLEPVEEGRFICEYAGEVIDLAEAERRSKNLQNGESNYIFVLREHSAGKTITTCIDPTYRGNLGRFSNHSCEPNMFVVPVRIDSPVPHLAMFAKRHILAGEELCYDYSGGKHDSSITFTKLCRCSHSNCKGYLPYDAELFGCDESVKS